MKIKTKYLGDVRIEETKIIQFSTGIPGFIDETAFVILDLPDNPAFQILQSIQSVDVAFVVTNPYVIYADYTFHLDDNILDNLQIKKTADVVVLTIVTLKKPFHTSTLNLKAPIIIQPGTMQGKQYILNQEDYSTKAAIEPINAAKAKGDQSCLF